ncbi:WbqC family protein [Streptomyces cucumeris]|uniref:WbqC family protein n=1 Tax=Streptomyces cucumeris TaxID=2962890 RepID=UPI003D75D980
MTASPVASSGPDLPPPGGLCAIHQPNLFPRLSTLAKLFAADYWIVLDDVQFSRRDYQHRARLAAWDQPLRRQWLTIPTHLPSGRATTICDAVVADPLRSRRRLEQMPRQHYRSSPHWSALGQVLERLGDLFATTDRTAEIAEASTRLMLDLLGWRGGVLRSSSLAAGPGRSQRLADLAEITGARGYLCGTGGSTYLDTGCFAARHIAVVPFRTPSIGSWEAAREISAVCPLMRLGPRTLAAEMSSVAVAHRRSELSQNSI